MTVLGIAVNPTSLTLFNLTVCARVWSCSADIKIIATILCAISRLLRKTYRHRQFSLFRRPQNDTRGSARSLCGWLRSSLRPLSFEWSRLPRVLCCVCVVCEYIYIYIRYIIVLFRENDLHVCERGGDCEEILCLCCSNVYVYSYLIYSVHWWRWKGIGKI